MKVAIVGSGAAAIGVLAGLEQFAPAGAEITVFDLGGQIEPVPALTGDDGFGREDIARIYRRLHAVHGRAFPPPKSHFGQSPAKYPVDGKTLLWKSEHRGGLTNFWGGGMFPFAGRDFAGWPVSAEEMAPYYRLIADRVGVCGEPDALTTYFRNDYINRPPLQTSPVIEALCDTINSHSREGEMAGYRMLAGSSRLALETRPDHPHACVYSGECMLGCPREAIWSAGQEMDHYQAAGIVSSYVVARVSRVQDHRIYYQVPGRLSVVDHIAGPFDRIYLAAGCIGSTEIVMRSLGLDRGPQMLDSALLSFPILYAGRAGGLTGGGIPYFSLCNLSLMAVPSDPAAAAAQVSIYPAFDHLWRYYLPESLWSAMRGVGRMLRWRLLLGRVYLTGAANSTYDFQLRDDHLFIRRGQKPAAAPGYRAFRDSLRRAANHSGFYIPPLPPIIHGTSSHYAGTLPYGGGLVDMPRYGRIAPGVYLADASTFPRLPAISPTFTIMANACRTAHESLQD